MPITRSGLSPRGGYPWMAVLLTILLMAWCGAALWFQFPTLRWLAVVVPLAGLAVVVLASFKGRRWGWLSLLGLLVLTMGWWLSIRPMQSRDWAPDVAHGVEADIDGSKVTLRHVRDFSWRTRDDAEEKWITTTVDLDQLTSVDFVRTVWASPHIAHTMMSFGFADGQYVVFSAEIRRERHERFSELGGFFKQFELVLIAATEDDIVKLRTNARGEDVSIYPLALSLEQRQGLFLSYLDLGNELAVRPRWYQTITSNCTTMIWKLARHVDGRLPLDWRVLLSGHSQDYLYDIGVISNDRTLDEIKHNAHVTERARALPTDVNYSAGIRAQ